MSKKTLIALRVALIVLCIVWQGVIFGLSSEDSDTSTDRSDNVCEEIVNVTQGNNDTTPEERQAMAKRLVPAVRALAHVFCYFVLGGLYFLLTSTFTKSPLRRGIVAFSGSLAYSFTDELHQYFVPGRSMQFVDVLKDCAGAAAAILILTGVFALMSKKASKKTAKT